MEVRETTEATRAAGAPAQPTRGASWLIDPVGAAPQFTGADFTEEDLLYAKTAEDFVRDEVLPRGRLQERTFGPMPWLARFGPGLVHAIASNLDPFEGAHRVMTVSSDSKESRR